jgi:predicted aspartyl protease
VRLPARIDAEGQIIVRLVVNGRGLDFALDTGCSTIVIDRGVATELGLPEYGRSNITVAGPLDTSRTVIPHVQIGSITMHDVVVDTLPFTRQTDERSKLVGLLGFDFLAGGVVKIDYQHGTVDMMRYGTPFPTDIMIADTDLDDQVPTVPLIVNGAKGERFILDTGSDGMIIFSSFAARNAKVLKNNSPSRAMNSFLDLVTVGGVGGELHTRPLVLDRMQLGSVSLRNFFVEVLTGDQPSFEGEDTDGLIGASALSAFDVYLDYANSRVGFVLNASGKRGHPARGTLGSRTY